MRPPFASGEACWQAPPGIPYSNQHTSGSSGCAPVYLVDDGFCEYRPRAKAVAPLGRVFALICDAIRDAKSGCVAKCLKGR